MIRPFIVALSVTLAASPAIADGWVYSRDKAANGEATYVLDNGAAHFLCNARTPLTFIVEISYNLSDMNKHFPPTEVSWLADDERGAPASWKHEGIYVWADPPTSKKFAAAAKKAKALVGIKVGKLTSMFDVVGLSAGLRKLEKACG